MTHTKELKIGFKFKSRHFKMAAEVCAIDQDKNLLSVILTPPTGSKWTEHDWNLQHTIWGFENGDYFTEPEQQTKDPGNTKELFTHEIFCGAQDTMNKIKDRGARALNRKTMRWQTIDKDAKYEVRKSNDNPESILYSLFSDKDLHEIAKQKNLII